MKCPTPRWRLTAMGRKIPFESVIRNLKLGRYAGRIVQADYSNLGLRLFEEDRFADNLGVSKQFLRNIGLVEITDQIGWHLPQQPTIERLRELEQQIKMEADRDG